MHINCNICLLQSSEESLLGFYPRVVCRQLGMTGGSVLNVAMFEKTHGSILLGEVSCEGTEDNVMECNHSSMTNAACRHTEDLAIGCDPGKCLGLSRAASSTIPGRAKLIRAFLDFSPWLTPCTGILLFQSFGH